MQNEFNRDIEQQMSIFLSTNLFVLTTHNVLEVLKIIMARFSTTIAFR